MKRVISTSLIAVVAAVMAPPAVEAGMQRQMQQQRQIQQQRQNRELQRSNQQRAMNQQRMSQQREAFRHREQQLMIEEKRQRGGHAPRDVLEYDKRPYFHYSY